jgi:hypothetical protein
MGEFMSRTYALIGACLGALFLTGCANVAPVTDETRQTPSAGGSVGQMGPGYCHTLPADVSERMHWNDLCNQRH